MKKKIALLLCMILTVLSVTLITASASEYNADNDYMYVQIAEQWSQAYTSFPVEQLEDYQTMGYITDDQVAILQTWMDVSESVGNQVEMGESSVQLQGEDVVVTTPLTCENGSAYFVATFDGNVSVEQLSQTGEMKSAKFTLTLDDNSGSLGVRMKNAALNTFMGIASVFIILIIIIGVISLLKYVPMIVDKVSNRNKEVSMPVANEVPAAASTVAVQTDDAVLAAVITAAVAAAMSAETGTAVTTDQLIVRSIKRAGKR